MMRADIYYAASRATPNIRHYAMLPTLPPRHASASLRRLRFLIFFAAIDAAVVAGGAAAITLPCCRFSLIFSRHLIDAADTRADFRCRRYALRASGCRHFTLCHAVIIFADAH